MSENVIVVFASRVYAVTTLLPTDLVCQRYKLTQSTSILLINYECRDVFLLALCDDCLCCRSPYPYLHLSVHKDDGQHCHGDD